MLISDVFRDGRSLMFFNALIQVSARVAHIIRISQITLEVIFIVRSMYQNGSEIMDEKRTL